MARRPSLTGRRLAGGGLLAMAMAALPLTAQDPSTDLGGPGPEHAVFAELEGAWSVQVLLHGGGEEPVLAATGLAEVRTRLGGRFLEAAIRLEPGAPAQSVVYLVGFDRRNERDQVVNLDDSATYLVIAEGAEAEDGGWVAAHGTDGDPNMAALGFDKEFVFALELDPGDGWAIQTRFVDTRTEARPEIPFMTVQFTR